MKKIETNNGLVSPIIDYLITIVTSLKKHFTMTFKTSAQYFQFIRTSGFTSQIAWLNTKQGVLIPCPQESQTVDDVKHIFNCLGALMRVIGAIRITGFTDVDHATGHTAKHIAKFEFRTDARKMAPWSSSVNSGYARAVAFVGKFAGRMDYWFRDWLVVTHNKINKSMEMQHLINMFNTRLSENKEMVLEIDQMYNAVASERLPELQNVWNMWVDLYPISSHNQWYTSNIVDGWDQIKINATDVQSSKIRDTLDQIRQYLTKLATALPVEDLVPTLINESEQTEDGSQNLLSNQVINITELHQMKQVQQQADEGPDSITTYESLLLDKYPKLSVHTSDIPRQIHLTMLFIPVSSSSQSGQTEFFAMIVGNNYPFRSTRDSSKSSLLPAPVQGSLQIEEIKDKKDIESTVITTLNENSSVADKTEPLNVSNFPFCPVLRLTTRYWDPLYYLTGKRIGNYNSHHTGNYTGHCFLRGIDPRTLPWGFRVRESARWPGLQFPIVTKQPWMLTDTLRRLGYGHDKKRGFTFCVPGINGLGRFPDRDPQDVPMSQMSGHYSEQCPETQFSWVKNTMLGLVSNMISAMQRQTFNPEVF